jgi:hypothetical protein
VEWLVNEFAAEGMELDITATDYSAVMMNEVTNRRERLNWGKNVKSWIMDAQVPQFSVNKLISDSELSREYIYSCLHDVWDNVDPRFHARPEMYAPRSATQRTRSYNVLEISRKLGLSRARRSNCIPRSFLPTPVLL